MKSSGGIVKVKRYIRILAAILLAIALPSCGVFRPITDVPAHPSETTASDTTDVLTPEASVEDIPIANIPEDVLPPEKKVVSFVGAGDNIVYYGNVRDAASCAVPSGRKYNFAPIYDSVRETIQSADIAFINQETLMCGDGYAFSYYPRFNGPQDMAYDLADVGFDVVNIANNHMLDKGESGLSATIDFWRTVDGITLIGGYKNEQEFSEPHVIEVNGVRIAFLSYTFFTNYLTLPKGSPLVIPNPDEDTVTAQIARAHELADFLIVSVHWDEENIFKPNDRQITFANFLCEQGVDVILGHHPHVIQPIEYMDRPDGGKTLCVYSLGNFVAEMDHDYNLLGGLITFDIVKHGDDVSTENVVFLPTVYYFTTSFYKNHVYFLSDFTDDLAKSHGLTYYGRSITVSGIIKYLKNTISAEFLPEIYN